MKLLKQIEAWLRANVPVTAPDKTQHQNLTEILMWLLVPVATIINPNLGLIALIVINLMAWAWEIPTLKAGGWKWPAWKDSLGDYKMTFKVTFIPFIIIVIMQSKWCG